MFPQLKPRCSESKSTFTYNYDRRISLCFVFDVKSRRNYGAELKIRPILNRVLLPFSHASGMTVAFFH